MKRKTILKAGLIVVVLVLVVLFFASGADQYLTVDYLKGSSQALGNLYADHKALTIGAYMAIYILVTGLSLPGAAAMTLAGGALFGLLVGTVAVSFASTIGATLAFLAARFLFKDVVQQKFGKRLEKINEGVKKDGAFFLFTLRLVPVFPFFVINLAMALTPIRTAVFYLVSQIGMLPGTLVYVNAGTRLAEIRSAGDILSFDLILAFILLGLFPWIAKLLNRRITRWRAMSPYQKPKKFDYNLVVIGAGSAGLVSAYIAATVKSKVALIEKEKMGGDCLNTGCVPSKALIKSARVLSYAKRAKDFGFAHADVRFDFKDVMERVHRIIKTIEPHDSIERYSGLGVECITGEARITSPYSVEVNGRVLTTRAIVVATGAKPFVPPIPGLDQAGCLTSDSLWSIRHLPERLVVLGGGPIGCEMAQAFAILGSAVTQVEMGPQIMGREDPDVAEFMEKKFTDTGIRVLTRHQAKQVLIREGRKILVCDHAGQEVRIEFDDILVAVGRKPNSSGFGLESLGVEFNGDGTIRTDAGLQTRIPTIFCAGDVAGPFQFTHAASYQAWFAAVNSLFGSLKKFKVDYRVIPWTTFTEPEVARVGMNETDAAAQDIDFEVTIYGLQDLDRAIAESEAQGFVKVLTRKGSDAILGATIVGPHAGEWIHEYVLAMKYKLGLNKILGTIHIYPTLAEANRYAAGEWKKAHAPGRALRLLEKFHRFRRGKKR